MAFQREETAEQIKAIIAAKLNIDKDTIKDTATFQDLGADSIDSAEIVLKMEDQLGIEIDDEKAEHLTTIADVIDYVHALRN